MNNATDNENVSTEKTTEKVVTTENSVEGETYDQQTVNTENNTNDVPNKSANVEEPDEPMDVNTENMTPTSSRPNNLQQTNPKEDWSSLMFSSEDSLFKEMTKHLEDGEKRKKPTSTITSVHSVTQNQDTLLDIVQTVKKLDAITGLLMLGADLDQLDAEVDNELMMPVNRNKQPDNSEPLTKNGNNCCDTGQNDTIGKIELFPSIVLSSRVTNYKNDIHKFL